MLQSGYMHTFAKQSRKQANNIKRYVHTRIPGVPTFFLAAHVNMTNFPMSHSATNMQSSDSYVYQ